MTPEQARDKVAIAEAISAHGLHADCREFAAIRTITTPDALYDHSSCFGPDFKSMKLADFLEGDEATCRSHVRAAHRIDSDIYIMGGMHRHRMVRLNGEWKIGETQFDQTWTEGDTTLFEHAAVRSKGKTA